MEIPEHIITAAKDLCEYMPPHTLAFLVDYWSDEPDYLPLAQIAFDAGVCNCGSEELAGHVIKRDSFYNDVSAKPTHWLLEKWSESGVKVFHRGPESLTPEEL